jgi:hypothetical protein
MNESKNALILLTYNRINFFEDLATLIENQTNKDFELFIYNSGPHFKSIELISKRIFKDVEYNLLDTINDDGPWRKHKLAKDLAKIGYEKILFLDDDIVIPKNYVDILLSQYEEKSYKSWWAWDLDGGKDYYNKRIRILDPSAPANYCGSGVCIIDSSIFLDPDYFNIPNEETKWIDDIWLSFYAKHVLGWKLSSIDIPELFFSTHAGDSNALYIKILSKKITQLDKQEYVDLLKNKYDWKPYQ